MGSWLGRGNLTLLALNARHLRDVNVQAWHPNVISMCLGVDFALPEISLDAFYDVDVTINLESDANGDTFRIFGKGPARYEREDKKGEWEQCLSRRPTTETSSHSRLQDRPFQYHIEHRYLLVSEKLRLGSQKPEILREKH